MNRCWVWAPRATTVELVFLPQNARVALEPTTRGHFQITDERIQAGQCYGFSLDGERPLPDPRSQLQPEGVHGPSCWVDFSTFDWTDGEFQQKPLAAAVIYELHIGTFSPSGTFEGAIEHLPKLKELGVTHVEVMPVAHFPGKRGWGYDGVALFAPHTAYGGPLGLHKFVDACHRLGLAVLLDVVYNHLGPSGNYLGQYGPYFTPKYHTPWGDALNFDDAGSHAVRRFVCDNALHWLRHYHIDGLRLDAIHAIFDQSATHILAQLADEVDALSVELGRHLVLIAESGLNDARIVRSRALDGYGMHSQWSDDFHHALHCTLTEEQSGYYRDFGRLEQLAEALRHGFVYRGQYSTFRDATFGGHTRGLRGRQLVSFVQNHDQVGNRAVGDRLSSSLGPGPLKIAAALCLLAPFVPLIFMGEEWGSRRPFQYFTDHEEPELAEAVRQGRRREFAAFGWTPEEVPDPQSVDTFLASRLDWDEGRRPVHQDLAAWYAALLKLRRSEPSLADDRLEKAQVSCSEQQGWLTMIRGDIAVVCNFTTSRNDVPLLVRDEVATLLSSDTSARLTDAGVSLPATSVVVLSLRTRQAL